jgi:predicted acyl esterase
MRRTALRLAVVAALAVGVVQAPGAAADATPGWFSYGRPATYGVVTARQDVPMRDGTRLACSLTRPIAAGRFPAVVVDNTPYSPAYQVKDTFWAPRGYAAITCNPRGTMSWLEANKNAEPPGASFTAAEQRDWYDLVEWLARQPWSTGKVGVLGFSYGGIVAMHAAGQRPPHLRTVITGAAFSDAYSDLAYLGGARTMDIEGWMAGLSGHPQQTATARKHPLYDDFWRTASIATKYPAIRASGIPILDFGGWYDIYQQGVPTTYQALRKQTWLVMSGGTHLEGAESVPQGGQLAWMDHWLRGAAKAPLPTTRVTSVEKPEVDSNHWQQLSDWPAPDARSQRLWLRSDGSLGRTAGAASSRRYAVNAYDGRAKYWGTPEREDPYPDQRQVERTRAGWQLPALTRDLVVAGDIRAHVRAALSAKDTNFVVRVLDVAPDGTTILVTSGWLKASHRLGHGALTTVVPGTPYDFDVDVWPTHWRFKRGHAIRVSISGGDVPRIEPDAPQGNVDVFTGRSWVELDVRR